MNNKIFMIVAALLLSLSAGAVELDSLNRDSAYVASIVKRSEKIVSGLNVTDAKAQAEVTKIIANRYFKLNDIYTARDKKVAEAKASLTGDAKNQAIEAARAEADAALYRSHFAFPADLSLHLTQEQIEGVKDGMTFNVLNVTYAAHLDMIPTLIEEEKAQIYAWLVEARELAIDAESSKKKHETFGKYKGRINNYLAKRGYDLTKEREAWAERVKARGGTL
jgi:Flp pilus assembly protein TadG